MRLSIVSQVTAFVILMQVTVEQELVSTMVLITRREICNNSSLPGGQELDKKLPFRGGVAGNQQKKPGAPDWYACPQAEMDTRDVPQVLSLDFNATLIWAANKTQLKQRRY